MLSFAAAPEVILIAVTAFMVLDASFCTAILFVSFAAIVPTAIGSLAGYVRRFARFTLSERAIDGLVCINAVRTWMSRWVQEATQVHRDLLGRSWIAFPIAAPWFWEGEAGADSASSAQVCRASVLAASSERLRRVVSLLYRTYSPPTITALQELQRRCNCDGADDELTFTLSVVDQNNRAALISVKLDGPLKQLTVQGAIRLAPGTENPIASMPAKTQTIRVEDISLDALWSAMKPSPTSAE